MVEPFAIASERLLLRKLVAADLDALVELDSDPEIMRYINGGAPNTRRDYLDKFLPRMLAWTPEDPVGFYAALLEGEWIGWFHLRPSIAETEAETETETETETALEIGYRLRRAVWGRGLATEGSRALIGFGLDELRPAWIDGCTRPDNLASIAVLERCGLRYVDERVHPRAPIRVAFYRAAPDELIRGSWRRSV